MFFKELKTIEMEKLEKLNNVKEFVEKYSKDYYVTVDFQDNGNISVFVGSERNENTEQQ